MLHDEQFDGVHYVRRLVCRQNVTIAPRRYATTFYGNCAWRRHRTWRHTGCRRSRSYSRSLKKCVSRKERRVRGHWPTTDARHKRRSVRRTTAHKPPTTTTTTTCERPPSKYCSFLSHVTLHHSLLAIVMVRAVRLSVCHTRISPKLSEIDLWLSGNSNRKPGFPILNLPSDSRSEVRQVSK